MLQSKLPYDELDFCGKLQRCHCDHGWLKTFKSIKHCPHLGQPQGPLPRRRVKTPALFLPFHHFNMVCALHFDKGCLSHNSCFHKFKLKCNFAVIVPWQQGICGQHGVSILHAKLWRLQILPPQTVSKDAKLQDEGKVMFSNSIKQDICKQLQGWIEGCFWFNLIRLCFFCSTQPRSSLFLTPWSIPCISITMAIFNGLLPLAICMRMSSHLPARTHLPSPCV